MNLRFRQGDVVRFRRGSNEYVGTVKSLSAATDGLVVQVERSSGSRVTWRVQFRDVLRIDVPVLTEKERAALVLLDRITRGGRHRRTVADIRSNGHTISGTTLHGLAQRGLVSGAYQTVSSTTGPLTWAPTSEGRRIARY